MTSSWSRRRAALVALAVSPLCGAAQVGPAPTVDAKVRTSAAGTAPRVATIAADEKYRAGAARRWFLGDAYRDLWATAMRVPVLDLATYAGGLKPLKAGGGMQTKSLRLVTKDGIEYVFRCVQKDHAWTVPARFKGLLVESMSRDQVSAGHPVGALVTAPLAEAAGVLHVTPSLVIMPLDAPLGEFSADFAGQLGMIEAFPHKPDKGEGFAGAAEIIDSEELLGKLNEDPLQHVDAPAFLTARLIDFLVGDWDRHPGQWKWARMPASPRGTWVAIPRDHDMAFVSYEGVVAKIGRIFSPVSARFSGTSANVRALTWNSLELDRRLLGGLDKPAWDSVAADVTRRLSDAVIDAAVAGLPAEFAESAPRLAAALRERRTRLPDIASAYYVTVFDMADIHASDEAERATIARSDEGFVDVRVVSAQGATRFVRRFDARETKEIRLYLHGGDDSAVVTGNVRRSIPVRIIGGNGTNWFADSSVVDGRRRPTFLYDKGYVRGVSYGKDTLFNRQHWEAEYGHLQPAGRDRGHAMVPSAGIGADRGMGITPRIGLTRYAYGFERRPYASRLELEVAYATGVGGFRVVASADKRLELSPVHFTAVARMSKLELINYYGVGNATSALPARPSGYFAARQRQVVFHPAIAVALGLKSDLSLGPIVQFSSTDSTPDRFISAARPYGFGKFGQAGVQLNLHHDVQDRASNPEQRFMADLNGTLFPASWDVRSAFEALSLGGAGAFTLPVVTRPMIVFRAGGKKVFGDFPFHEAAFLGGTHTTRYMEAQRYSGDAVVYGSAELRIPVATMNVLMPFDVGVLGLADGGRVWVAGDSPGGWHGVLGGGLWFSLRGEHMKVVTVSMTNEKGHAGVHLRTGLGF